MTTFKETAAKLLERYWLAREDEARCAAVFESLVGSFSFQYREKEGVE